MKRSALSSQISWASALACAVSAGFCPSAADSGGEARGIALKVEVGSFDKTFDYAHVLDKEYYAIKRPL